MFEITFMQGSKVLAQADCSSDNAVPVGQTVTPSCISADPLPTSYDSITINDTF